jgi:biotin synthase-related radical SAM superfamily protein
MLNKIQKLKIQIMSDGIVIDQGAREALAKKDKSPTDSFENHSTTSGIVLILPGDIYVNARFSEKKNNSEIKLNFVDGQYVLIDGSVNYPINIVPLPIYVNEKDLAGNSYKEFVVTIADRIRISPIVGCSFGCKYCDINRLRYKKIPVEELLAGIDIALRDTNTQPKHLLISGGTPRVEDRAYLDDVYEKVTNYCQQKNLPVDVMLSPRDERDYLERLKSWGVDTLSINIEIFNEKIAREINPQKAAITKEFYLKFISQAVKIFGKGKVRSLLIIGLEPLEDTLKGVEALAKIGCDVALSPFIPFEKTDLAHLNAPTPEDLKKVYLKSLIIVNKYDVKIGPRCIPCQHNTLAFPDDSGEYFFN